MVQRLATVSRGEERVDLSGALASALRRHEKLILADIPEISTLRDGSSVADGCAIYAVDKRYIVHLSPPAFPEAAISAAKASRTMRARLGPLGSKAIEQLADGRLWGRSYAITPLCEPLRIEGWRRFIERRRIAPEILSLIEQMAGLSVDADYDFRAQCAEQISYLASLAGLSEGLRKSAQDSVKKMAAFPLKAVPMHGDLHAGNVMRHAGGLVVIDWGTALPHGYAIYDLMRFSDSIRMSGRRLRAALQSHARILGIRPDETGVYLNAALAHFATHLEEFPLERFIAMAENCYSRLQHALRND